MGEVPFNTGLDEGGAFAPSGAVGGLGCGLEYGHYVASVHLETGHAVALGATGDALNRHLFCERDGYRVFVVLAEEYDGQLMYGGEVHGLMDLAHAGGAVAEVGDDYGVLALHPRRQRRAHSLGHVGGDHVGNVDDPVFGIGPVSGELPRAAEGLALFCQKASHDFCRCHSENQQRRQVSVVDIKLISSFAKRPRAAYLRRLVALG